MDVAAEHRVVPRDYAPLRQLHRSSITGLPSPVSCTAQASPASYPDHDLGLTAATSAAVAPQRGPMQVIASHTARMVGGTGVVHRRVQRP